MTSVDAVQKETCSERRGAGLVLAAVTNERWHLSNVEQLLVSYCMSSAVLSLAGDNCTQSDFPPLGGSDW